jgi:hypothetical protein
MNVTVPVGVPAADLMVAVKVTACPYVEGFSEEPIAEVVGLPAGVVTGSSTRPGALGLIPIGCEFGIHSAVGVVFDPLVSAAVGPHIVFHGLHRMTYGHIFPGGVASILRGVKQQFQGRHAGDDDGSLGVA